MNKRERELAKLELQGEREVLSDLRGHFEVALARVNGRIDALSEREDLSGIRQRKYQEMLRDQITPIMDDLKSGCYETVGDYLRESYEQGFLGTFYNLQGQGIPLMFPISVDSAARAVEMTAGDVKLSNRVYSNVDKLQKQVIAEITRGIADGSHSSRIAESIASETDIAAEIKRNVKGRNAQAIVRSMTIARTEKGRVKAESSLEAMRKAKEAGADIVKQWDATLDSRTREDHRKLDGQVREIEEDFEIRGVRGPAPRKMGRPEHDINCRCQCLQRARAALEMPEAAASTKWDGDKQCFVDLSDAKSYAEFKRRYEKLATGATVVTGALNDENDPYRERRDRHAESFYEEVRNRDKAAEVAAVAANSGVSEEAVANAYDHLFVNEHDLYRGHVRFDPDYNIAESWRRLREGKDIQPHDITLLRHEAHEYDLMSRGLSYDNAHAETEKLYNYTQELMDFIERKKGG